MERMVKNSLRKLGTITLVAAFGASVLAGCGSNAGGQQSTGAAGSTDKNNTIRVAVMTGQPDQYQIFVGQQQGLFREKRCKCRDYRVCIWHKHHRCGDKQNCGHR